MTLYEKFLNLDIDTGLIGLEPPEGIDKIGHAPFEFEPVVFIFTKSDSTNA